MADGFRSYTRAFTAGLRPDPPLWVDDWADRHMFIPPESGAAEPGKYRVSRTPFAREVMRKLSPEDPAQNIVVKGCSQLLKTQSALNAVAAWICGAPANIIILEPTDNLAKRVAARFDKTVSTVSVLRERVARRQDRDARNTASTKEFKGGTAWFLSARSASNLAEASARYLIVDEVDRLLRELKGEGDPIGLAQKRQSTYGHKAKAFYISSPTEEDASRIAELHALGDQREYNVPCPHCDELQPLKWERVGYDLTSEKPRAWIACMHCGGMIEERHKPQMMRDEPDGGSARWVPTCKPAVPDFVSYEINMLYAPLGWTSWLDLAREYVEAEAEHAKGNPEKLQVFYNTRLAKTWTQKKTRIDVDALIAKAEAYTLGIVPVAGLVLTATVDVQGNRLEAQIVAWGYTLQGVDSVQLHPQLEPWIVQTHVIYGDPTLSDTWAELDAILTSPIRHADGKPLTIRAVAIDSGDGDNTAEVYEFCRTRRRRYVGGYMQEVVPIKGHSKERQPIISKPTRIEYNYRGKPVPNGVELYLIGTDTGKDWIYNRLALSGTPIIHLSRQLDRVFFEQLLSEVKVTRWIKGKPRKSYELVKKGARNEQLDMLNYNLAMAYKLGLEKYTVARWQQLETEVRVRDLIDNAIESETAETATPLPAQLPATTAATSPARRAAADWWGRR